MGGRSQEGCRKKPPLCTLRGAVKKVSGGTGTPQTHPPGSSLPQGDSRAATKDRGEQEENLGGGSTKASACTPSCIRPS